MKPIILLLATASILSAQTKYLYIEKTGRDSYTVTIPDNNMPRENYTPRMETSLRGAMDQYGYDYGSLDSRYPVKEVIPRSMLPSGAQRQLEEDDIRMRQAKINEDRSMLDLERDKIALKTIDATQEQERIGLEKLRQLQPGSATFETDVATIINELPFAASGKAFSEAMNVLNTAHTRKLQSADIIERGRIAREEAQGNARMNAAYNIASEVGPQAVSRLSTVTDPNEALRVATESKAEADNAMIRTQLRNAGLDEKKYETNGFFDAQSAVADIENVRLGTKQVGQLRDDKMQLLRYRNSILADIGKATDDAVKAQLQTDLAAADDELRAINDQIRSMNPASPTAAPQGGQVTAKDYLKNKLPSKPASE